jgi:hypothetical protein
MTSAEDGERRARVALSFLAKPGDPLPGAALRTRTASELLALITGADPDGEALLAAEAEDVALQRAVPRWRDRLGEIPSTARLAAWQDSGLRVVIPADAEWPTQLDDLGDARPLVLWLRGTRGPAADLCQLGRHRRLAGGHRIRPARRHRTGCGTRRKRRRRDFRRRLRYENPTARAWVWCDAQRPVVPNSALAERMVMPRSVSR